jgi:UDP-N-acetyl-D-galactosamine dehydrogenase
MELLPFKPGLVGGHYMASILTIWRKSTKWDYHPEIILAGRRLNDSMGDYVAS